MSIGVFLFIYLNSGALFLKFNSKIKLGDQLIKLQINFKDYWIFNLNGVIISRVLGILASQNRFQSMYD